MTVTKSLGGGTGGVAIAVSFPKLTQASSQMSSLRFGFFACFLSAELNFSERLTTTVRPLATGPQLTDR